MAASEDLAGIVAMGLTAEQVAKMTADMLRPMLLKALAPMRPS